MRCDRCHNPDGNIEIKLPRGMVVTFCEDCGIEFSGAILTALEKLIGLEIESRGQIFYLHSRQETLHAYNRTLDDDEGGVCAGSGVA